MRRMALTRHPDSYRAMRWWRQTDRSMPASLAHDSTVRGRGQRCATTTHHYR